MIKKLKYKILHSKFIYKKLCPMYLYKQNYLILRFDGTTEGYDNCYSYNEVVTKENSFILQQLYKKYWLDTKFYYILQNIKRYICEHKLEFISITITIFIFVFLHYYKL